MPGVSRLRRAMQVVAAGTDRTINLTQLLTLLVVAEAGDAGIDQGRLSESVGASSAATSRTVRILGPVHYNKKHEGYGLVDFEMDRTDNRRRVIRLSPDGRALVARMLEGFTAAFATARKAGEA